MNRLGIDWHTTAGGFGFFAAGIIDHYNAVASAAVATATAIYMGLRAWREWKKINKDDK